MSIFREGGFRYASPSYSNCFPLIMLSNEQIDAAIPSVAVGLEKYMWLQSKVAATPDFHASPEFQRKFNSFYRVRRRSSWRHAFFCLMREADQDQLSFQAILEQLRKATGRYESSFASKLFATLHPSSPVIDSIVLKRLGLRIPSPRALDRTAEIVQLHTIMAHRFAQFLPTESGGYLIQRFDATYPHAVTALTPEKKLDLVLWQSRSGKSHRAKRPRRKRS